MSTLRIAAPVSLGRLMDAEMIRAEFFAHLSAPPSVRWVAGRMPTDKRQRVGKRVCWWESDVRAALMDRAA